MFYSVNLNQIHWTNSVLVVVICYRYIYLDFSCIYYLFLLLPWLWWIKIIKFDFFAKQQAFVISIFLHFALHTSCRHFVTLTCRAVLLPSMLHIDWFKGLQFVCRFSAKFAFILNFKILILFWTSNLTKVATWTNKYSTFCRSSYLSSK